jgi:hypothetical protein
MHKRNYQNVMQSAAKHLYHESKILVSALDSLQRSGKDASLRSA